MNDISVRMVFHEKYESQLHSDIPNVAIEFNMMDIRIILLQGKCSKNKFLKFNMSMSKGS